MRTTGQQPRRGSSTYLRVTALESRYALSITVQVDFGTVVDDVPTDFRDQLIAAQNAASITAPADQYSDAEIRQMRDNIMAMLANAYRSWPITFTFVGAVGRPTIDLYHTAASKGFGADSRGWSGGKIDVFNEQADDTAYVFVENCGGIIADIGSTKRERIAEMTGALGSVAIHEFGHELGLTHEVAFFYPAVNPASTGRKENTDWMLSGDTAYTSEEQENMNKTFSPFAQGLLSFAANVGTRTPVNTSTLADPNTSSAHAHNVDLSIEGFAAFVGEISNVSADWYHITVHSGQQLSIGVFSTQDRQIGSDDIDCAVEVFQS